MGPISYESDLNPLEATIALIPWGSSALTSLTLNPGNSPVSTPRFYLGFANAESVAGKRRRPERGPARGETALMTAARTGDVATIEALIEAGADVNARDRHEKYSS